MDNKKGAAEAAPFSSDRLERDRYRRDALSSRCRTEQVQQAQEHVVQADVQRDRG